MDGPQSDFMYILCHLCGQPLKGPLAWFKTAIKKGMQNPKRDCKFQIKSFVMCHLHMIYAFIATALDKQIDWQPSVGFALVLKRVYSIRYSQYFIVAMDSHK